MRRVAAVFCMAEDGHFQRLRPIVSGLVRRGLSVHVFTHERYAAEVRRTGAAFQDLFAGRELEHGPDASTPVPCRYVTFAGEHGGAVARELAALGPALVVNDAFAVAGRLAAESLGLPHVQVSAGHALDPARTRAALASDERVRISSRCRDAVTTLRERHGVADASPFSYVAFPSPWLNAYGEPPEFLTEDERRALEPVVFFGSLPPAGELGARRRGEGLSSFGEAGAGLRLYASLGTVVWRYWPGVALAALAAVAEATASIPGARAVLSLGHTAPGAAELKALERPGVTVAAYVDQWAILGEADVFLTHHGLSSTHEAIWHEVPMLSYPMFWDQPALAAKCQELGLARPLVEAPRGELGPWQVRAALEELARLAETTRERLAAARAWEVRTVEGREAALDRILALI
jgi:UDP:flavonoid glycosyltransferase YjiC (YdhE family)